jgi:SAM-dependent methyltransferase
VVSHARSRPAHNAYAPVAAAYAERYFDELAHKPFDRMWLDRFADLTRALGRVCDAGCGPGQVARYLRDRGVSDIFGIDISEEMVQQAAHLSSDIAFERQDILALDLPPDSLGGIVAFYAIVHFDLEQVEQAFRGFQRTLRRGGYVLVAFHVGDEVRHVDELLGSPVDMDFVFFQPDDVIARFEAAGLEVQETTLRYPYPDVEVATRRAYILARRPD